MTLFLRKIFDIAFKFKFVQMFLLLMSTGGISRPEVFCKKGALAKFTGKHQSLCNFIKKKNLAQAGHRYFPVNFSKFLRRPFLKEQLR